jgi:hypothetical protein
MYIKIVVIKKYTKEKVQIFGDYFPKNHWICNQKFQNFAILQNLIHKKANVYVVWMLPTFQNPQIQLCIIHFIHYKN